MTTNIHIDSSQIHNATRLVNHYSSPAKGLNTNLMALIMIVMDSIEGSLDQYGNVKQVIDDNAFAKNIASCSDMEQVYVTCWNYLAKSNPEANELLRVGHDALVCYRFAKGNTRSDKAHSEWNKLSLSKDGQKFLTNLKDKSKAVYRECRDKLVDMYQGASDLSSSQKFAASIIVEYSDQVIDQAKSSSAGSPINNKYSSANVQTLNSAAQGLETGAQKIFQMARQVASTLMSLFTVIQGLVENRLQSS